MLFTSLLVWAAAASSLAYPAGPRVVPSPASVRAAPSPNPSPPAVRPTPTPLRLKRVVAPLAQTHQPPAPMPATSSARRPPEVQAATPRSFFGGPRPAPAPRVVPSPEPPLPIWISVTPVNGSVSKIIWASNARNDAAFLITRSALLYRSVDGGTSWQPQELALRATAAGVCEGGVGIESATQSSSGSIIFVGSDSTSFTTSDAGDTYVPVCLEAGRQRLRGLRLHPTDPSLLLGSMLEPATACSIDDGRLRRRIVGAAAETADVDTAAPPCSRTLLVSRDSGATWTELYNHVLQVRYMMCGAALIYH